MSHRLFLIFLLTAVSALAQTPAEWVNEGVRFFKNARYQEAEQAFQRAVSLNPGAIEPHLYLGTVFMTQWIPGADSRENGEMAHKAQAEFETVLRLDPKNLVALQSLASLAFHGGGSTRDAAEKARKLDEATEWNRRILAVEAQNRDAYYNLGVITWMKFYPELSASRVRLGMRPEDPGPLRDLNTRQDLRARFGDIVDEGLRNLQKALEIDPEFGDAMAYMNLLIRERADLRDTVEDYRSDVQTADAWVQKALETKRSQSSRTKWFERAPPPPPPPPSVNQPPTPAKIRIGGNVQAANLVRKVDPVYPPQARQARIQGSVRFEVVIGKDGRVLHAQLTTGHPLLVSSALEAVKQWIYRPTLLNGEPVEVITTIEVPFVLEP
jgi:TonB family protein